jgi:hypothetical protein
VQLKKGFLATEFNAVVSCWAIALLMLGELLGECSTDAG